MKVIIVPPVGSIVRLKALVQGLCQGLTRILNEFPAKSLGGRPLFVARTGRRLQNRDPREI
jgi:hypothetical protein